MTAKRIYFPPTTPQQRQMLFENWEQSENVTAACRKAHVGRGTFYYWKPRFVETGSAGLETYEKVGAPVGTGRVAVEIQSKVLDLHAAHAAWGKKRLADELTKANNWVPLVSPNSVRRILREAGLWKPEENQKKSAFAPVSRTADVPGQTLNIDLLFVPACHQTDSKLPAVSGSSGHLVVERLAESGREPDDPGQVFKQPALSYTEAMETFVEASQPLSGPRKGVASAENPSRRAEIRQLRQEVAELRAERRRLRQLRKAEDVAWRAARAQQRCEKPAQPKSRARSGTRKRQSALRRTLREQRQQHLALRHQEDAQWHLDKQSLRERMNLLPVITTWIAILLVTDNCSRQCLGLPLFVAGSHVTAEMVVAALRVLLPADLQFLISDRGVHFTAQVFQQLATEANFIHVVIARHRPQSNGIAERFVRTIKEWLADKTWASDQELFKWLHIFLPEYNDRPHQGLPLPGLSPNEFAKRLWLM